MDGSPVDRTATFILRTDDSGAVLVVTGDVDASSAPQLRSELVAAMEDVPAALRIDLAGVEFLDSLGLSVLVAAQRRADELGVALELANPAGPCRRVLEITRLTDLFRIVP